MKPCNVKISTDGAVPCTYLVQMNQPVIVATFTSVTAKMGNEVVIQENEKEDNKLY